MVTTYNQWVFGVFSAGFTCSLVKYFLETHEISSGWTAAFVTSVYHFDTYSPTIIECLTFWIASAMRLGSCCRVPQVGDDPDRGSLTVCTVYHVYYAMGHNEGAALALSLLSICK